LYIKKKRFTQVILGLIICFLGLLTFSQNYIWRNTLTFYRWIDKYSSSAYLTRNNLANIYAYLGLDDLAIKKYEEALKANPKVDTKRMDVIVRNLSIVEENLIKKYERILKSKPWVSVSWYNLAYLYERKGRLEKAISCYKKAIEINPKFVQAISNLGNVYEKQNKLEEAMSQYQQAIAIEPKFAKAYFNIGVVLANQGRLNEAKEWFKKALEIEPNYQRAKQSLLRLKQMLKEKRSRQYEG
jgi:tetratricopeptide (TPR) repeat protein